MNDPAAADIWVLLDDRAGNRGQALGVAEALGRPFREVEIRYGALAALPNVLLGAATLGLDAASRARLAAPWPELVIAAGRRTAPVARAIKRRSGGRARLVQVMAPGAGTAEFDLIALPAHDPPLEGANVMRIVGAPHRVTAAALERAAAWRERFQALPRPWVALIVGGSTRRRTFTAEMASELGRRVAVLARAAGGSVLATTSRRSGDAAQALADALDAPHHLFRWGDEGDNPYFGYLALADAVVVTGESVSMCSEACAVERPVYLYAPRDLITAKHGRLHEALYDGGYARPLGDSLDLEWRHPALDPAAAVAAEIRKRFPAFA